ncbi:MAG: hypothetical protein L0H38_02090 [bacterium]|nr:hypothetical protein [bacterium]
MLIDFGVDPVLVNYWLLVICTFVTIVMSIWALCVGRKKVGLKWSIGGMGLIVLSFIAAYLKSDSVPQLWLLIMTIVGVVYVLVIVGTYRNGKNFFYHTSKTGRR